MADDKQMVVMSTKNQIKEAKESFFWKDIERELNIWKEGFRDEMESVVDNSMSENPSTASVLLHMG